MSNSRFARALVAACAWSFLPTLSLAAPPAPAAEPAPSPPTAATSTSATAPPTAPAAPTAPTSGQVLGVPLRFYGILHAMTEVTEGVQSFDSATAVAPTSALHPLVVAEPDRPYLSLQVQQTRLGFTVGEGTPLRGVAEIDFTHFEQSSPTVQAYPRIRILQLDWTFAENQKLFVGQTWDVFGNATGPQLLSHSFNLVGTLFRAGNVGFMRHQIGYDGRFGDVHVTAALGLPGANAGPTFSNLEAGLVPTASLRVLLHADEKSVVGASGIATALRFTAPGEEAEYRPALGGQFFADVTLGKLNVHAEAYVAQNLANTGALDLAYGRFGQNVVDGGAYLSGKLTLGAHALTAMGGFAAVLDPDDVVPGYLPPNPAGSPPTTLATLAPASGPGITRNASVHVGYWFSPLPGFSLVVEPYVYATEFRLAPADAANVSGDRVAFGGMFGSMYTF